MTTKLRTEVPTIRETEEDNYIPNNLIDTTDQEQSFRSKQSYSNLPRRLRETRRRHTN